MYETGHQINQKLTRKKAKRIEVKSLLLPFVTPLRFNERQRPPNIERTRHPDIVEL